MTKKPVQPLRNIHDRTTLDEVIDNFIKYRSINIDDRTALRVEDFLQYTCKYIRVAPTLTCAAQRNAIFKMIYNDNYEVDMNKIYRRYKGAVCRVCGCRSMDME